MISTAQQTPLGNPAFKPRPSSGRASTGKDAQKQNIWNSMLEDVATTKGLPEKQLIILGGTPDQQKEFLEVLNPEASRPKFSRDRRRPNTPPASNRYALGYTYQDILDADGDDVLARLSIYMLATPAPSFAPFLRRLFTVKTIPDTLITILLDWSDPWSWPRQLLQWIRLLRSALISLDDDVKIAMEENMTEWKDKRKGINPPTTGHSQQGSKESIPESTSPIGPGEWDEGLGVPLCVVCHTAERIETLEKDYGWEEGEFDFIAQWMRTVLLKHGGSLIYTTNFDPNGVQLLINSTLGIHSLLKRETVKYNIVDRDKALIPPNWDSWAKIRILMNEFDIEGLSNAWSVEIQDPPEEVSTTDLESAAIRDPQDENKDPLRQPGGSAVAIFEATLPAPTNPSTAPNPLSNPSNEVNCPDVQTFLSSQAEVLERLKVDDEREDKRWQKSSKTEQYHDEATREADEAKMAEQIGPVQFNVGGIQVDAEEAVRGLKEREADRVPSEAASAPPPTANNEALASFFAGLMQKGKGAGVSREGTPGP